MSNTDSGSGGVSSPATGASTNLKWYHLKWDSFSQEWEAYDRHGYTYTVLQDRLGRASGRITNELGRNHSYISVPGVLNVADVQRLMQQQADTVERAFGNKTG